MKTGTKRRFMAAVLCFATLFAMTVGSVAIKPVDVKAAGDDPASAEATLNVTSDQGNNDNVKFDVTPTLTVKNGTEDVNNVSFTVQESDAAEVDTSTKKVTFKKTGEVTITAKATIDSKEVTGSIKFKVVPSVTKIELDSTTMTLKAGSSSAKKLKETVTVSPDTDDNKKVTWSTSDNKVATVSEGTVTAVAKGTATITATSQIDESVSVSCNVTVEYADVTGITLEKSSLSLVKGKTETLNKAITPNTADPNTEIEWKSNNESVATVSNGTVTAIAKGTATITASVKDKSSISANCSVTVTEAPTITTTSLPDGTVNVVYNQEIEASGDSPITLSIDNKDLPTGLTFDSSTNVISGKPTAVTPTPKNVKITATNSSGSTEKTLTLAIKTAKPITKITLSKTSETINVGESYTPEATVTPTDVTDKTLKWTSSDESVATVDEKTGEITGVKAGTATITAAAQDGSNVKATISITVANVKAEADINNKNDSAIKDVIETDSFKAYAEKQAETGKEVIIDMDVVATTSAQSGNAAQSSLSERVKRLFNGVKTSNYKTHFLEIDITKKTRTGSTGSYTDTDISDTTTPIEVELNVDFSGATRTPAVFRYHGNTITQLTALSSKPSSNFTDATFYFKDTKLYIYSRYFSSYVVAYPTVTTYTVSFNTNGGTTIDPVFVESGGTITAPTSPTRSGYTFGGWFTDQALTQAWNSNTAITSDMTLYARWTSSSSDNSGSNSSGGSSADGGRSVNPPQTSDRMDALWGIIILIVVLNGAYIAYASRRAKRK